MKAPRNDLLDFQRYQNWARFSDTLLEKHMARYWEELTLNWGRLEFRLYAVLLPINRHQAHEWTLEFFREASRGRKQHLTRQELSIVTKSSEEFSTRLSDALDAIDKLCPLRNDLVHGLWSRSSDGVFDVQPLRLAQKGALTLASPVKVDNAYLCDLLDSMNSIEQKLAALGSEVLAYAWLEKQRVRRHRHSPQ